MAITFSNTVTFPAGVTSAGITTSYGITIPTGTKVFLACVHGDVATSGAPANPSFVRLNGVDLVFVARHIVSTSGQTCFVYKYDNPPTGAVTLSSLIVNPGFTTGCSVVATNAVTVTAGTSVATTATSYSAAITSDSASTVLFFVATNNAGGTSAVGTSGQAVIARVSPDGNGATAIFSQVGAATVTGTWTQSSSNRTSVLPITLLEAGAGGSNTFTLGGSGGGISSGVSTLSRVRAPAVTGGLQTTGSAAVKRTRVLVTPGGVSFAGSGVTSKAGVGAFTYVGSGGLQTAGNVGVKRTRATTVSGGLQTTGNVGVKRTRAPVVSGGGSLSGSGASPRTRSVLATGSVLFTGSALLKRGRSRIGTGSTNISGTATMVFVSPDAARFYIPVVAGGVVLAGAAASHLNMVRRVIGSGALALTGQCWFDYITSARRNSIYIPYVNRTVTPAFGPRALFIPGENREFHVTH